MWALPHFFPTLKDFDVKKEMSALRGGEDFEVGDMLFERITDDRLNELKEKYGSSK